MIFDAWERKECFVTGEQFGGEDVQYPLGYAGYKILVANRETLIQFNAQELINELQGSNLEEFIRANRHIFLGLIFNGQWLTAQEQASTLINRASLERILRSASYPKTPAEKKDNLLNIPATKSEWGGSSIAIYTERDPLTKQGYFLNVEELFFYIKTLEGEGLIECHVNQNGDRPYSCKLTYSGLSAYIKSQEEGLRSNRCFVAMSFDSEHEGIFSAIKSACYEAGGYEAFLVKDEHLHPEQTINDGIIAGIKKSKFCIADFTGQKDGVYFEAGYAVGRGMKVIYTCHEDWFKQSHFDTNHFPHILYKTHDELKEKLMSKIQAWID